MPGIKPVDDRKQPGDFVTAEEWNRVAWLVNALREISGSGNVYVTYTAAGLLIHGAEQRPATGGGVWDAVIVSAEQEDTGNLRWIYQVRRQRKQFVSWSGWEDVEPPEDLPALNMAEVVQGFSQADGGLLSSNVHTDEIDAINQNDDPPGTLQVRPLRVGLHVWCRTVIVEEGPFGNPVEEHWIMPLYNSISGACSGGSS